MDLKIKLNEKQTVYKQIVERIQQLDQERARLLNDGVKLEGQILLLNEQLADEVKVVAEVDQKT